MIADVVSHMGLTVFQITSLLLFLAIYILAFAWLFRRNSRAIHDGIARRAIDDDMTNSKGAPR